MVEIKRRRKVLTEAEIMHMIVDYNNDMPIKEIMEKYGISKATVFNILNRYSNE